MCEPYRYPRGWTQHRRLSVRLAGVWLIVLLMTACTSPTQVLPPTPAVAPTETTQPEAATPLPPTPTSTAVAPTPMATAEADVDPTPVPDVPPTADPAFDGFVEEAHTAQIRRDPEVVTEYGLSEALGMDNSRLTDLSDAYQMETYALYESQLTTLLAFDRAALAPEQQLTYDLFLRDLEDALAGKAYRFHTHPVRQVLGVHTQLLELMTDRHPMRTQKDAEDYVARLEQFPVKIAQLLTWLELQHTQAIVMPAWAIRNVIWQLDQFVGLSPERTELYTVFVQKLDQIDGLSSSDRAVLRDGALAAIAEQAQPAYRDLQAYFRVLQSEAPEEGGLYRLPDGAAAYAHALQHHTTTDLTADEIHRLGIEEVARIQAEMDGALDALGIGDGQLADRIEQVATQGGAVPAGQVLDTYAALIEDANQLLSPWFETTPKATVVVEPLEYTGTAYYVPPSLDGTRPGTFYAGVGGQAWRFSMPTLAYHEAVPGHHFQLALAQELEGVPAFRRISSYTAYAEGWALYAERLAWEAGWYDDDPHGNIGRLQAELFRAARLVVDTGIHAKGWTRQQAIDYMVREVGQSRGIAQNEVERYILWPGQATAYKVGMMKLLDLRSQAEETLGDDFDIREFHGELLMEGSLPLSVLEEQVAAWLGDL